jgi:hypothetical protein
VSHSEMMTRKFTDVSGKKTAAYNAQAQAAQAEAQAEALLKGLNLFTHLEPNAHRWDVSQRMKTESAARDLADI